MRTQKSTRSRHFFLLIATFTVGFVSPGSRAFAASFEEEVKKELLKLPGSVTAGISVVEGGSGKSALQIDSDAPLLPASVMKLVTTYVGLRELGADFRFRTEVFSDVPLTAGKKQSVKTLYVRGHGDPTFVEERMFSLVFHLMALGISKVETIVLDQSLFINPTERAGLNPYQAAVTALPFNYNSTAARIAPTLPGQEAIVSLSLGAPYRVRSSVRTVAKSGREQLELQENAPPSRAGVKFTCGSNAEDGSSFGEFEVRGVIRQHSDLESEYIASSDPDFSFGCAFIEALRRAGAEVPTSARIGVVPASAFPVVTAKSHELGIVLRDMNRFSSNFMAEQILFSLGADGHGNYSKALGIERVKSRLADDGISVENFQMADGSGLSRQNRISARQLTAVLAKGFQNFAVFPELVASLTQTGREGTLEHRDQLESDTLRRVWAKTGTIDGVSSLAGYLESDSKRRFAFSILVNGPIEKARAIQFENAIVRLMMRAL